MRRVVASWTTALALLFALPAGADARPEAGCAVTGPFGSGRGQAFWAPLDGLVAAARGSG